MKRLAANLLRIIEERGLSQKAASDLAGEHPMTVFRLVNEINMPRVGAVLRIATALGVTVDKLLAPIEKKIPTVA